jgi:hypothetical protein
VFFKNIPQSSDKLISLVPLKVRVKVTSFPLLYIYIYIYIYNNGKEVTLTRTLSGTSDISLSDDWGIFLKNTGKEDYNYLYP